MTNNTIQLKLRESFNRYNDHIAVEYGTRRITYEILEKQSNLVAHRLLKRGITRETFIGILLPDRMELICAIIGILKAGCVFVPLDTAYPDHMLETVIQRSDIRFIIGDADDFNRFSPSPVANNSKNPALEFIPYLDLISESGVDKTGTPAPTHTGIPGITYSPEDKIYIYFTSGTTGEPKAVVGKNSGLLHFVEWEIDTFGINESFRISQITNPGFDVYLRDIFVPLCSGATVCIPAEDRIILSGELMKEWIDLRQLHLIHCVPSLFRLWNTPPLHSGMFKSLKYILFAGEKVVPAELKNWYTVFTNRVQLVNLYGPTETTLAKLFYLIQPADLHREVMPVGKHIRGARVILINEPGDVCKDLECGEIYIRTPHRTYGYYKDLQLNKEKFIPNPFNKDPNDIIYKTGDLGRRLMDGNIELLGRVDRQVKIRGMRVELDGIENVLLTHPQVKEAVVINRRLNEQNQVLTAFVTANSANRLEPEKELIPALREYLAEKLPTHMNPAEIHFIAQIPRKVNGKINYTEISELAQQFKTDFIPPANDLEKKLVEIWTGLLAVNEISVTRHFFELGGNSLRLMTLVSRIHREFDVGIPLGGMFKNMTIRQQAEYLRTARKGIQQPIAPVEAKEYYPLSSSQKRLYILQQLDTLTIAFNMPQVVELAGPLEQEKLENTFRQMIARHENFRTSFLILEGQHRQRIHKPHQIKFQGEYYDICDKKNPGSPAEEEEIINKFVRPFALSLPPVMRIGLIKILPQKHILMVDMHHILADHLSLGIFVKELNAIYGDKILPPLKLHYKDYSQWHNRSLEAGELKKQEDYWLEIFKVRTPDLHNSEKC
jgi:amino acid adenylation domain-containing protein